MTSEVRITTDGISRTLEVLIDGEVEWIWGSVGEDEVLSKPSTAILRALVLNAFALKSAADTATARLEAAFVMLREMTLERDEALRDHS